MLNYLNGIDDQTEINGIRKRIFSKVRAKVRTNKPLMAKVKKAKLAVKKAIKSRDLNTLRAKKAMVQSKLRASFQKKGEPFILSRIPRLKRKTQYANFDEGEQGIDTDEFETENENIEQDSDQLGLIYPDLPTINGRGRTRRTERRTRKKTRKDDKIVKRKEKAASKVEKRRSKAKLKSDRGEAKKTRAEGKRLRGEKGGFDFKGALTEGGSFVKSILNKGGGADTSGGGEDTSGASTSESGGGTSARSVSTESQSTEQSFFEKNKMLLIGGGAVALIGAYFLTKKK